jgi:HSP20 family protein
MKKKRGFFERLTGSIRIEDEEYLDEEKEETKGNDWMEEENDEAELAVDVYQTHTEIIVKTMVAGVKPEDVDLTIARDMILIKGKREEDHRVDEENYFVKELYWGKFSRTILLPQEIEPEEAEANEKNGLLTIKLQKLDKDKKAKIKIKSI